MKNRSKHLANVLQKIQKNACKKDQASILNSSLRSELSDNVLDNLMLPTEVKTAEESKLITGVLNFLQSLNLKSDADRKTFKSILEKVLDIDNNNAYDENLIGWLAKRINKRSEIIMNIADSI